MFNDALTELLSNQRKSEFSRMMTNSFAPRMNQRLTLLGGSFYISMSLLRFASRPFAFNAKLTSAAFYSTMKEAIIHAGPKVEIIDSPIPNPKDEQVVTKVVVSGSNPKDWKRAERTKPSINQGDDIAGIVHSVGSKVVEFKPGDRIAAFHQMGQPGGSYAEYAVSSSHATFHIPKKTTFEGTSQQFASSYFFLPYVIAVRSFLLMHHLTEAATIPLAAMTAAMGLYQRLSLPVPWHPTTTPTPLIIYGAASAVGSYTIQLAQLSNIHPLICVAGRGIQHVESLIDKSKGDIILDYRDGDEKLVQNLKAVVKEHGEKLEYAFDCVSDKGSYVNICEVLDHQTGQITLVLLGKEYTEIPATITKSLTRVSDVFKEDDLEPVEKKAGTKTGNEEFGYLMFRFFGRGLQEDFFKGHPYEVVPRGLRGVEGALRNLKEGRASAVKYVFRIGETEGGE